MIEVVEELGAEANGKHSNIQIEIIPDEYKDFYQIQSYDGDESVCCDPLKLVQHKLEGIKVQNLTDQECRNILESVVNILSS